LASEINGKLKEDLVFDAFMSGINWDNYNLKIDRCHPSQLGYGYIAKTIADIVEDKKRTM